jgi:hypothetical protein
MSLPKHYMKHDTTLCDKVYQWLATRYNWNMVESGV